MEEVWKLCAHTDYEVSSLGNVRARKTGLLKAVCVNSNGYTVVSLSVKGATRNQYVHRLVAEAFIGNPHSKPTVHHIDHVPQNNRVDNLEWATIAEQNRHLRRPATKRGNAIVQLTVDGAYVDQFPSTLEAARRLTPPDAKASAVAQAIGNCVRGTRKQALGFLWRKAPYDVNVQWRPIAGTDGWWVSETGCIRKGVDVRAQLLTPQGYMKAQVYLDGAYRTVSVHRIVASTFLSTPSDDQIHVNHIDGNKLNNNSDNLEWVTRSENAQHAVLAGLCKYQGRST